MIKQQQEQHNDIIEITKSQRALKGSSPEQIKIISFKPNKHKTKAHTKGKYPKAKQTHLYLANRLDLKKC